MKQKGNLDLISGFLLKQADKKIRLFEAVQDGRVYNLLDILEGYHDYSF